MGSFPCAWSPEGADAMARLRSWLGSGFALPPRTRESEQSPRRRERRERKLARHLARQAGGRVMMWQHLLEQIYERIRPASLNSTGLM